MNPDQKTSRRAPHPGDTGGMMAVEACVGLTLFMMVMFALYGLIVVFTAQSLIGHALTESSQSLSLEAYGTSKLTGSWSLSTVPQAVVKFFTTNTESNDVYVSDERWFDTVGQYKADSGAVAEMARARFAAYLGGGEQGADTLLKSLGVADGLDGMDFSASQLSGADLTIAVSYTVQLPFRLDALHLGEFSATQSVCSRMWATA